MISIEAIKFSNQTEPNKSVRDPLTMQFRSVSRMQRCTALPKNKNKNNLKPDCVMAKRYVPAITDMHTLSFLSKQYFVNEAVIPASTGFGRKNENDTYCQKACFNS